MEYNLEIAKLQSHANLVKILARIAVSSTAFTIITTLRLRTAGPSNLCHDIVIPVAFVLVNNYITKYYQTKIEYLTNEFLTQKLDTSDEEIDLSVKRDSRFPNIEYLRNRGSDDKGPAFGIKDRKFSTKGKRVDAMKNRDYDDIEAINSTGEEMLRIANEIQSQKSSKTWSKSETTDQDIIEAGVDNLGDLIKTGWFEKNRQDDAVQRLYQDNEGNQI